MNDKTKFTRKSKFTRKTKTCSKCGEVKDITAFYKRKGRKNGRFSYCKKCQKAYQKEYLKSDKYKASQKAYQKSDKGKAYRKEYLKEYRKSDKYKASQKAYQKSDKGKACQKEYLKSDKYKASQKAYQKSDKGKAYRKEYLKEYRKSDKSKAYQKEYQKAPALCDTYAKQIDWCEEVRKDPKDPKLLQVKCALCQNWFNPTNSQIINRISAVNGRIGGDHNLYCSDACKGACPVYRKINYRAGEKLKNNNARPDQGQFRDAVITCAEYRCEICGEVTEHGIAHHVESILYSPLESMDINNGIYVCKDCHKRLHADINCSPVHLQCKPV